VASAEIKGVTILTAVQNPALKRKGC